jgi:hypothetical protein
MLFEMQVEKVSTNPTYVHVLILQFDKAWQASVSRNSSVRYSDKQRIKRKSNAAGKPSTKQPKKQIKLDLATQCGQFALYACDLKQ